MYPIDLSGKKGIIFGVANDRSIAWSIASVLAQAGARLALTYQNDRLKERVVRLVDTLDGAIALPCDAAYDEQIVEVLADLSHDPEWMVRYFAASALRTIERRKE